MPWLRGLGMLFVCWSFAAAGDWQQWLGPNRDAASTEKVAPWKEAPRKIWSRRVGEGNSSPVVANGLVFVHAKVKDKNAEVVYAYDARIGKCRWSEEYERAAFKSLYGNGPRATPAFADGRLYPLGITGVLTCWHVA